MNNDFATRISVIRAVYDNDEREHPSEPGCGNATIEGFTVTACPDAGCAWILSPPVPDSRAINRIRDAICATDPRITEVEWKCFSWDHEWDCAPGEFVGPARDALSVAGFAAENEEAILYRPVGTSAVETSAAETIDAESASGSTADRHITVRIARTAGDEKILDDADAIHSQVWGGKPLPRSYLERYWRAPERDTPAGVPEKAGVPGNEGARASIHVAYIEGRPVSYGRFQKNASSRFAGFWGGATIRAARGRGAYRALVHSRIAEAREYGCSWVMADAIVHTSMPILLRMGFMELGRTRPFIWRRADS